MNIKRVHLVSHSYRQAIRRMWAHHETASSLVHILCVYLNLTQGLQTVRPTLGTYVFTVQQVAKTKVSQEGRNSFFILVFFCIEISIRIFS